MIKGDGDRASSPAAFYRIGLNQAEAKAIIGNSAGADVDLDADFAGGAIVSFGPFVMVFDNRDTDFL